MVSLGGSFFTKDGIVPDEALLKKQIYEETKAFVTTGLSKKVSGLLEVLRMECCVESLPIQEDRIHVENGTLYLDGSFSEEKAFCRNRLPVRYNPNAREPVQWKAFLSQLLQEEDILTLQRLLGYPASGKIGTNPKVRVLSVPSVLNRYAWYTWYTYFPHHLQF